MKQGNTNLIGSTSYVFKNWSNKSYSVFNSLSKVIKISALICTYNILLAPINGIAQVDTAKIKEVELEEVIISAERSPVVYSKLSRVVEVIDKEEIESAPIHTIDDVLEYAMNVDVRQRGNGVQADVSIRGGTFEQTLILLNGVKINDPQTGHHNLNIPVPIESIQRIEILEGPGSRVFGPNAFSGAINIITGSKKTKNFTGGFSVGEHGYFRGTVSATEQTGLLRNHLTFSRENSDGYLENTDFNISNIFYHGILRSESIDAALQTGYQVKGFGANSFYTAAYPDQYERTRTFFLNTKVTFGNKIKLSPSFNFRRHFDRFELFREDIYKKDSLGFYINGTDTAGFPTPSGLYPYSGHNYHMTDVIGGELNTIYQSSIGKTSLGLEYRYEKVLSNVLGELMNDTLSVPGEPNGIFTKKKVRDNISLFIEHIFYLDKFTFSGGVMTNWNSDFDWHLYSGFDASYNINKNLKILGSMNQSFRIPTYTDLYYVGPTNIGNPNLKPEEAITYELGTRYRNRVFSLQMTLFRRNGRNMIDWVKQADSLKWESLNITKINSSGFEIAGKLFVSKLTNEKSFFKTIQLTYSNLYLEKQSGDYISAYVLDYLKHKFVAGVQHKIIKNMQMNWKFNYQDRAGTYTNALGDEEDYAPFTKVDAKISYNSNPFYIYIEATNLFDIEYRDFGYIILPGRWLKAGFKLNLDFKN